MLNSTFDREIIEKYKSRGSGISLPHGYPRAFEARNPNVEDFIGKHLSEKTNSLSPIGLSVKDWTKLWRMLKVCFLDLMHSLIAHQATP